MTRPGDLLVSVIVPVRNGRDELQRLVAALRRQSLPRDRFEVIIGDDGSTDGAGTSVATADGWIRVSPGPPLTSYAARNRAVRLAQAPVLAFTDADCEPEADWLRSGLAALEQADIVAGSLRFILPERVTLWTVLNLDMFLDQELSVGSGTGLGGNLFFRRELYERLGGFDESLPSGGDSDLVTRCVQAGGKLVFSPDAVCRHPTRDRAKTFLGRIWVQSKSRAARETRAGRRPYGLRLRWWVPVVSAVRARRRIGRTLLLDRRRLELGGIEPSLRHDLLAAPIMYLVLPYLSGVAQIVGWWDGRRRRRSAAQSVGPIGRRAEFPDGTPNGHMGEGAESRSEREPRAAG